MRVRRLAGLVVALGIGAAVASSAPAASAAPVYPPVTPAITVSADVVDPGTSVTVTGTGFQALSSVTVSWTGPGARGAAGLLPFGSRGVSADSAGTAATAIVFTAVGMHTITMAGLDQAGAPVTLSADVQVRSAAGAVDLPRTGFPVLKVVGLGLLLVMVGLLVVLAVRRRRAAAARPAPVASPQQPAGVGH